MVLLVGSNVRENKTFRCFSKGESRGGLNMVLLRVEKGVILRILGENGRGREGA